MVTISCCSCGTDIVLAEAMHTNLRERGTTFYCPAGHGNMFRVGKSEADKLKEQLDRASSTIERLRAQVLEQEGRYRCIVAGCDEYRKSKSAMRTHLSKEHQIREDVKRLPADGSRDALNSDVGAP